MSAPKTAAGGFGVSIGPAFVSSCKQWLANIVPLSLGAILTLGVYSLFRAPAASLWSDDRFFASIGVDLVGLILAGTLAVPWYTYALHAARDEEIDIREPFQSLRLFKYQAVASFWFWAGILLGLRYLAGLPSILVLLLYAFHGFVVADDATKESRGGMKALGTSVRLTEKKRIGLFALMALLIMFNMFGALPLGLDAGVNAATIAGAGVGLTITTSISLVFGAHIYDAFAKELRKR